MHFFGFDFILHLSTHDHHDPVCAQHLCHSYLQAANKCPLLLNTSVHCKFSVTVIPLQEKKPRVGEVKNTSFLAEKIRAGKFIRPDLPVMASRNI